MIPNEEKREAKSERRWHYVAVKKISALLRRITYKHHGDSYCLNCLHSLAKESNKKDVKIKTFVTL